MAERRFKLVKFERKRKQPLRPSRPSSPLTAAEEAEAAYFRRLVEERAARQMMLQRIMAELAELDEFSSAA